MVKPRPVRFQWTPVSEKAAMPPTATQASTAPAGGVTRLFISYARRDGSALALRLVADLSRAGHEPWFDKAEILGGDTWSREIETAIDGCDALLAILTEASFDSRICRGEQSYALSAKKPVVPLLGQANARRPVYLSAQHYLDFSDPAQYGARLDELLRGLAGDAMRGWERLDDRTRQQLQAGGTAGKMISTVAGPPDWPALVTRAGTQLSRWFDGLAGRGTAAGTYESALYVPRSGEQAALARLADGERPAMVVIGEPGWGKTNLLADWARARSADGDAVLAWAGDRVDAAGFSAELARDLGYDDEAALDADWARLSALAPTGRRLWLLIDGLNDARGAGDAVRGLLQATDALVARLPAGSIRVVLSCTPAAWQRMDRQAPLALSWGRYAHGPDGADVLTLDRFTPAQAQAAWAHWCTRLSLTTTLADLPPDYVERLREPVLLRLLAESLQGRRMPEQQIDFDTLVFQRYHEQRVRRREDQTLVEALAAEMLAQRSAALPMQPLRAHPTLGPLLSDAGPDGAFNRLLDDGVLSEMRGNLFDDDRLRFTYPQIGAYALVRLAVRRTGTPVLQIAREFAAAADELPLAWEAALTLLVLRGDAAGLAALADDTDPELRQLALETLVRAHAAQPTRTHEWLAAMLDGGTSAQQHTALRAAFLIGSAARDLLVRGALSSSADLRLAVRDTLYLLWQGVAQSGGEARSQSLYYIWRHAPDITRALMQELVGRLHWTRPKEAARILGFVLDLTITIYVNHCERPDVIEQTAALFHTLTVERLHLDKVVLGAAFERVVFRVVAAVFADRLLQWMLLEGDGGPAAFFARPAAERAPIEQAAAWLDPAATPDLAGLRAMLASEIPVMRGAATLVLAVQAAAAPARTEPWLNDLFDGLDPRGRSWLLAGLAVLWPGTPASWVALTESMTRRLGDDAPKLLPLFDALFVPHVLAAAKAVAPMPVIDDLLAHPHARLPAALRAFDALGVVGFYHPQPVLALLKPHLPALLADDATASAALQALATIRTLHHDRIDALLAQVEATDAVRRAVVAGADPTRVQQFMRLLGYYNNAVHFCIHYPRMRRGLAAGALNLLATAPSARDFITGYATAVIAMARASNFDLRQWTLPEADDARR
jgi:TIR domain